MAALETFTTDKVTEILDGLIQMSEPGDGLSHLYVWVLRKTALGLPDLGLCVFAIDYVLDPSMTMEEFVESIIERAVVDHAIRGDQIYLMAMCPEVFHIPARADRTRAEEDEIRRLQAAARIPDHPECVEVTDLYACDRDGRRYRARKFLTGDLAGVMDGIWIAGPGEGHSMVVDQLAYMGPQIRKAVGIRFGPAGRPAR